MANETEFGLGASVWTTDFDEQQRFARDLRAGMVFVERHGRLHASAALRRHQVLRNRARACPRRPARVLQREVGMDGVTGIRRAYLDHAATTPLRPEARTAMEPYLTTDFGNPSGSHAEARRARRAIDDAREELAGLLGADFGEVVFTSGGTEADNLAVFGSASEGAVEPTTGSVVCSAIEHPAVLAACRARAERFGVRCTEVGVDKDGIIDLDALEEVCDEDVGFVSVMTVNNELGTIQPLDAVAQVVRRRAPSAAFHTDAVQAAPWLDVADAAAVADLVAISAHKFGGPKGVGALVARNGTICPTAVVRRGPGTRAA